MQRPFGHTLNFTLSLSRSWLSLGPGWAALAGALSTGYFDFKLSLLLPLFSLWLLVDPILGTLWDLSVRQGLWRNISRVELPPPPARGFYLPYAQPEAVAGRLVLLLRRYQLWWRESYRPEGGDQVIAFGAGVLLALLISFFLHPIIMGLTILAIGLTVWAGQTSPAPAAAESGLWPALVQFLLPWLMGTWLWSTPTPFGLVLAVCYWSVYLGGLRLSNNHSRAGLLFNLGQAAAILLLLALRLLPGAALLSVLLVTQQLIKIKFSDSPAFLQKAQPYLVLSLLAAGLSLGSL